MVNRKKYEGHYGARPRFGVDPSLDASRCRIL